MNEIGTCWHADHTSRWRLFAEQNQEGWEASVYDREEKRYAFREMALDQEDAKARAVSFLVGIAPPITFHKGSSIEVQWTVCSEKVLDSE